MPCHSFTNSKCFYLIYKIFVIFYTNICFKATLVRNYKIYQSFQHQNIEDCITSLGETCDMIMEENCEYLGELVYNSPSGSVRTKDDCQDLCLGFEFLDCKYWSYLKSNSTCYLYNSQERKCQAIGGPQLPSIEECMSKTKIS